MTQLAGSSPSRARNASPKILFIGYPASSHSLSWIDLLRDTGIDVRLFGLPAGTPPADWPVFSYLTTPYERVETTPTRVHLLQRPTPPEAPPPRISKLRRWIGLGPRAPVDQDQPKSVEEALALVLGTWRPNIVHTLGFNDAAYLYLRTLDTQRVVPSWRWVAQARGGPDLVLDRYQPEYAAQMEKVLKLCDHFVADNLVNYEFALSRGLAPEKIKEPSVGAVSGTGGIDIDALRSTWSAPPSRRERSIVWPKAYEAPSSKAIPVLEAIRLAWDRIRPCHVHMLWVVQPEVRAWFQRMLSPEAREHCTMHDRIPRSQVLEMMTRARVMLAPSLTDGVPNSMLEAMACGAFPIVSPLETITPVVAPERNVLFARNLYPEEVAQALVRAMSDDRMVDDAAMENVERVRMIADRNDIAPRVISFYRKILDCQ
jgi:glycosyltransferase involved in cell wall biosynthesis